MPIGENYPQRKTLTQMTGKHQSAHTKQDGIKDLRVEKPYLKIFCCKPHVKY